MIYLDGINYSIQRAGGISIYFDSLIEEIDKRGLPRHLLVHRSGLPFADIEARTPRCMERYRDIPVTEAASVFMSSYYRMQTKPRNTPSVVTVHDFVYEAMMTGPKVTVHKWQKHRAIQNATDIICISEATRQDLFNYVGVPKGRIHVIHNGVSEAFFPRTAAHSHDGYILFVGKRHGYKNFSLLVKAMEQLPELDLICVGGEPWSEKEKTAVEATIKGKLIIKQGVSTEELVGLFDRATALVYPSLYEGFGIPIIEAMRSGCPAISIDCTAVREAGGTALLVAESNRAGEIAELVRSTMGSDRSAIVEKGQEHAKMFSWAKTHDKTISVLSQHL
ncbi:MAG: hypothetical protein BM558_06345 [Roseobacter sp. MedPE-SW]|nr:MAG: hypothetical protein BM558_06345 [Roseobacter sp. MedPE-SW]